MNRIIARLPESVTEICLVRLGIQVRRLGGLLYARRVAKAIDRSAAEAVDAGAGLLLSERFRIEQRHFGVIQYWRGFDELEAWTHRPPHSEWWREAVERIRTRGDFGIYHEAYLVPRDGVESIFLNCQPTGLSAFGVIGDPVGADTNSRGRLRRMSAPGGR
jgi:hypothetical protein